MISHLAQNIKYIVKDAQVKNHIHSKFPMISGNDL